MFKTITLSLSLALLLSSCSTPPAKIEFREVYIDRPTRLDPRLTTAPAFPAPPPYACRDAHTGQGTWCEEQLHEWTGQIATALNQAIRQIEEIGALQPAGGDNGN